MKRLLCAFMITCSLLLSLGFSAIAVGRFSAIELSEAERNEFVGKSHFEVLSCEPRKENIWYFDISESGILAIGNTSSRQKTVSLYSASGNFLSGLQFESSGDYRIGFQGDSLLIYFVRSDIIVIINSDMEVVTAYNLPFSEEVNQRWEYDALATRRVYNEKVYSLQSDAGLLNCLSRGYSALICSDQDGNQEIVYHADTNSQVSTVVILLGVVFVFSISAFIAFGAEGRRVGLRKKEKSQ